MADKGDKPDSWITMNGAAVPIFGDKAESAKAFIAKKKADKFAATKILSAADKAHQEASMKKHEAESATALAAMLKSSKPAADKMFAEVEAKPKSKFASAMALLDQLDAEHAAKTAAEGAKGEKSEAPKPSPKEAFHASDVPHANVADRDLTPEQRSERGRAVMEKANAAPPFRGLDDFHEENGKGEFTAHKPDKMPEIEEAHAEAIHHFTRPSPMYGAIREYESTGNVTGQMAGHKDLVADRSAKINEAFAKHTQKIDGVVNRGITVNDHVMETILGGGTIEVEATSSTSRDMSVAKGFAEPTSSKPNTIIFRYHGASGMPVEHVSDIATEHEVFLQKGAKFRVGRVQKNTDHSWSGGSHYIVDVHAH